MNINSFYDEHFLDEPKKQDFNFNDLIDAMQTNANKLDTNQSKINFDDLKKISDTNLQRDIIWNILNTEYNYCTDMVEFFDRDLKKSKDLYNSKNEQVNNLEQLFKSKNDINSTLKRDFELNKYTYDKKHKHLEFFKVCLITLGVLIILPILRYFNFISKGMAFLLFFFANILTLMYGVYLIKIDDKNRDQKWYNKFKFRTPTKKDIYNRLLDSENTSGNTCDSPNESIVNKNKFVKYIDTTTTSNTNLQTIQECDLLA